MAIKEMIINLLKDGSLSEEKIMMVAGVAREKLNEIKESFMVEA